MNYFTEKYVEIINESGMSLMIQVEAREKTNYFSPKMHMIDRKHPFNEGDLKKYSCSCHKLFLVKIYDLKNNMIRETILTPGDSWIIETLNESETKPSSVCNQNFYFF